MRDVAKVDDIISELEQINGWLCGINDMDNAIEELPAKKQKEIYATNSKYKTVDSINNLVGRLPYMKTVIDAPLEDFAPLFPPKHWQDTNANTDTEGENAIENWLSHESKNKIFAKEITFNLFLILLFSNHQVKITSQVLRFQASDNWLQNPEC